MRYLITGGYVEAETFVEGGQRVVYEVTPKETNWSIDKSSAFLTEGRYGH